MKKYLLLFSLLIISVTFPQYNYTYYNYKTLDAGNIELSSDNIGGSFRGLWNQLDYQWIVYDNGPWILGKINGERVLSINQWVKNYSPGPIVNGQSAMLIHPEDSLKYRVYKISRGDNNTNPDYDEWPVNFGAPTNNDGTPLLYGDQTLWTVFNSYDSTAYYQGGWLDHSFFPPVEIQQTLYSRNDTSSDNMNIWGNIVFYEWTVINKSSENLDSAYFGFWTDIDFEPSNDNKPGVDVLNQLGFCWTEKPEVLDSIIPPSVGYVLLYGPSIPDPGNTAIFKGKLKPDYKNLELNSFHAIGDDYTFPGDSMNNSAYSLSDVFNFAKGLTTNGNPIINPITNDITTFPYSGDPVTGQGWTYDSFTGGGAGFVFFSGPFNLAPNDTQWVMIALVPGLGNSNLNSISVMREKVNLLRSLPYDSLAFGSSPIPITDVNDYKDEIPDNFMLLQNFPNPFNPVTTMSYHIPSKSLISLKVFDIIGREVATLINEEKSAGSYEVQFDASSLSSGIYFYELRTEGFIQTRKMILLK